MRLGLALEPSPGTATLSGLIGQARACEAHGLELAWLDGSRETAHGHRALHRAAALSSCTESLRLAAGVPTGDHPLRIAEEASVADNCCGGRLTLVLLAVPDRGGAGADGEDPGLLGETADVVLAANSHRPFQHAGERWRIPARRPGNDAIPQRLTMTPPPAQPELPIWLAGPGAAAVARERGLTHVVTEAGDGAATREWSETEARLGRAVARLRRPAVRRIDASPDGDFDDEGLVAQLTAARDGWGLDTVVISLPARLDDGARASAIARLASRVRPRVALDALPAGLEAHWHEVLEPTRKGAR